MASLHNIVIIGTGFGGIYALKSLAKQLRGRQVHITIVGRQNYFLFTPMLHEVATGVISHHQAAVAVRELLPTKSVQCVMAEVQAIDRETKQITTDKGVMSYDTLLLATGATTNYFDVPGAAEYAMPFKSLMDAIRFRQRITENFEQAVMEKEPEKRKALMTVVVVGGGPTGVEFSAELGEMIFDTFLKSSQGRLKKSDLRICLLHRGASVIEMYPSKLQQQAIRSLERRGVEVCTSEAVVKIEEGKVYTESGEVYKTGIVLWMAGVRATMPALSPELSLDSAGRLVVDATLRTEDPSIYALGDAAAALGKQGKALPMLAQVAVQQGTYLGKAIKQRMDGKEPKPFEAHMLGELVSLGPWSAVGEVMGIPIRGVLASVVWKCVYLFKFASVPKRFKILVDWFVGLFSRRDITIS